ncbi:helix-turn-helix domain-containing protein [Streptomyces sp. NPDC003703]
MGPALIDDLRVFAAACRTGSLSGAARDLGCMQSAVSRHVKRLKRELGPSLLERHPRGIAPTSTGRLLHTSHRPRRGRPTHGRPRRRGPAGPAQP